MGIAAGHLFRAMPLTFTCIFKPGLGRRVYAPTPQETAVLTLTVADQAVQVPVPWLEDPRFPGWGTFAEARVNLPCRVPPGDVAVTITVRGAGLLDGHVAGLHTVRLGDASHAIRVHVFSPGEPWRVVW